jgi:hypothetical protein
MDEQVEQVEQVVEELPEYALMVDLPDCRSQLDPAVW